MWIVRQALLSFLPSSDWSPGQQASQKAHPRCWQFVPAPVDDIDRSARSEQCPLLSGPQRLYEFASNGPVVESFPNYFPGP